VLVGLPLAWNTDVHGSSSHQGAKRAPDARLGWLL